MFGIRYLPIRYTSHMKAATMSLTTQDLTAIKEIFDTTFDDRIETKIRPMVHEIVNDAIDKAVDDLSLSIGQGFNEATERFVRIEADITELKTDVTELKTDMREVKYHLTDTVRRAEFLDLHDRVTHLESNPNSPYF
jgi:SMC interacting uncharacterized protein involved in chromosome segregation